MDQCSAPPIGTVNTVGTLLVGIFFNTFLYGLVTYQFAVYYHTRFNDPPLFKCMVFFLFILDTFHSGSLIYLAWYSTVTNFGNPEALVAGAWPYIFTPVGTALAALITHIYLAVRQVHRIWRLTGSKFLYGVTMLLSVISFVLGMMTSIEGSTHRLLPQFPSLIPFVVGWSTTQVAVDTLITITLVIVFSRSRTGFHRTDTVVNRLIRCVIQTGLFASVFSLCNLITFVLVPATGISSFFFFPIGRIYTNTLLDTLITRGMLSTGTDDRPRTGVMFDSVYLPTDDSFASISMNRPSNVQLETEGTVMRTCSHSSEVATTKVGSSAFRA